MGDGHQQKDGGGNHRNQSFSVTNSVILKDIIILKS